MSCNIPNIPFVKGHMGGNEIILLNRADLPRESELASGLTLLSSPHIGGDQLGLLSDVEGGKGIEVKIVDINSRDYLPVCGGLTQVFGRAYAEFDLGELLGLGLEPGWERVDLAMTAGEFPVLVDRRDNGSKVVSVMDSFLDTVYEAGVEVGELAGVRCYRIGHFLVTFLAEVKKEYPEASFDPIDRTTAELLIGLQERFPVVFDATEVNRDFAVVGRSRGSEKDGQLIFPHNLSEGLVEQTCGSGTVAAVVAMVEEGIISGTGTLNLEFAAGGEEKSIGGPETTFVKLVLGDRGVEEISFSHGLVEILARGHLALPEG